MSIVCIYRWQYDLMTLVLCFISALGWRALFHYLPRLDWPLLWADLKRGELL